MAEVTEYVINVKLAETLSRDFNLDVRAERSLRRRRPDLLCYYGGLIIAFEVSRRESDALKDAEKRVEDGIADAALALRLKSTIRDAPEPQLDELVKSLRFDVKVVMPGEATEGVKKLVGRRLRKYGVPDSLGWIRDVGVEVLPAIVESLIELLVREDYVKDLAAYMKLEVERFAKSLLALDKKGVIYEQIHSSLYKLHSIYPPATSSREAVLAQAALSILMAAAFYEHMRARHKQLKPILVLAENLGYINGLRRALKDLRSIDYREAIEAAIEVLEVLPPHMEERVKNLVELGIKIAGSRGLLRRDLAGRVYREVIGNVALRKGLATYFTEPPAAYLLSSLAVYELLDLKGGYGGLGSESARRVLERLGELKVVDFACGTGTLLTSVYTSAMRIASLLKHYYGLDDLDLDDLGRRIIEDGIYGFDVLRHATQITAINLALVAPPGVTRENVFTVPLGYMSGRGVSLGSLELLKPEGINVLKKILFDEASKPLDGEAKMPPSSYHLVVMNPPFTRATGRKDSFEGEKGLFGFIVDDEARGMILKAYRGVRDRVARDLRALAVKRRSMLPQRARRIIERGPREYLNIGHAGEALIFLYLAYKYVEPGGVIAFVLPRAALSGVSWSLARLLLSTEFQVDYVIVSSDPERGYNFSEGSQLSEVLVVARRTSQSPRLEGEVLFVNLLKKPESTLDAIVLADRIRSLRNSPHRYELIETPGSKASTLKVAIRDLLEALDNWGRFVALPDTELLWEVLRLQFDGVFDLEGLRLQVEVRELGDLVDGIGVDRRQFHENFKVVDTPTPYPVLYGGGEDVRRRLIVGPNKHVYPKRREAEQLYSRYAARLLLPDRIWWDTTGVVAVYSTSPILSNIFYAARLRGGVEAEKALALWLNSTWGVLTVLVNRQETRGRWSSLKIAQWRVLPVIDVESLPEAVVSHLAKVFDEVSLRPFRRLRDQYNPQSPDPLRLRVDLEVLKSLNQGFGYGEAVEGLKRLYARIHTSLTLWMGGKVVSLPG
ncbi:MAG: hypothetical protein F7B17_01300 [Desulfurococcales archaeon]|nr:hypothetical protein [Desulfurococcales archaeon]